MSRTTKRSEKQFESEVKGWLKDHGAWFLKTWSNGVQRAGVPDILVCYKGRFIALELKTKSGRVSELQKYEIERIRKAGGHAVVLRDETDDFDLFKKFYLQM